MTVKVGLGMLAVLMASGLFLSGMAQAADWRETGCAGVVENDVKTLDLGDLEVGQVRYIVRSDGSVETGTTESLDGWVSFKNCKGNLVVLLSKSCTVRERYTTGPCRIKDIPAY